MLLIGMHPIAFMMIGTVTPPLGIEYDVYLVANVHKVLLTTIVNGGTAVYLLLLSPDLLYCNVYSPACTIEDAANLK
jgi:TRAP-type C4-dicarboxylate transport system permease large subunit